MKSFILLILGGLIASPAFAGSPAVTEKPLIQAADGSYAVDDNADKDEVQVLESKAIAALDDQKLVDAYIDTAVELEASKVFHATSGFTPKEYKKYKSFLKYRMQLVFEIHRRKLEVPPSVN